MTVLSRLAALGVVAFAVIACNTRAGTVKPHLRNVCDPDRCCDYDDDLEDDCCDPSCDDGGGGGGGGDDDDGGGGGDTFVCWTNTTWCTPLCTTSNAPGCSVGSSSCLLLPMCLAPSSDQCAERCGPGRHECDAANPCTTPPVDLCHGSCNSDNCQLCNNDLANPKCVIGCPEGRYQWNDAPGGCRCVPT